MYLFLDTETTGAINPPRIVQIGWTVTDENGNELRAQCFIVRPVGFDIPAGATRRHGITTEIARRSGRDISSVLEAFARDVATAKFLVGHNALFERDIVGDELLRAGHKDVIAGKRHYCTMRLSTGHCKITVNGKRGYKWPSLEELHMSLFGVTFDSAHHALADARACAKCFFELKRRGISFASQKLPIEVVAEEDEYDFRARKDRTLFEEVDALQEFLSDSERDLMRSFYVRLLKNRHISDKQRGILQRTLWKLEDRKLKARI